MVNGFENDEDQIAQLIKKDMIDLNITKVKTEGKFGRDECTISDCTERKKNHLLKEKLKALQEEAAKVKREYEVLVQKYKNKMDSKDVAEIVKQVAESEEIKRLDKIIMKQKENIDLLVKGIKDTTNEFDNYKEETNRIKTKFEADRDVQDMIKYLRRLEDKRDKLLMMNDDLDRKNQKIVLFNDKLTEAYNQKVREFEKVEADLKQAQYIQKKGMTFTPIVDGEQKKQKRPIFRWLFAKLSKN